MLGTFLLRSTPSVIPLLPLATSTRWEEGIYKSQREESMANSLELAGAGRGGGESDGGQESGQPQGQTHLTAQAHRHGKTARTQSWGLLALLDYHGADRCSRAGVRPCVLPSVPHCH